MLPLSLTRLAGGVSPVPPEPARPAAPGLAAARAGRPDLRSGLIVALLLLLPIVTYWPAIFGRYGFRDDYSILRESHDEPGKIVRVCSMQARPLHGLLLQSSFGLLRGIDDLAWLRLLSASLIGVTAAVFFAGLRALRWDRWTAAALAALLTVVPSAQIMVTWAVGWPLSVALLLALAGFAAAERAFVLGSCPRSAPWMVLAVVAVTAGALLYQSNTLFYLSIVAAGLWTKRRWAGRRLADWLARHLVVVALGLSLAFTVMMMAFARGWVPASHRVALEHDWPAKLGWFIQGPLQNALAVIALNSDAGSRSVHRLALLVAVVTAGGMIRLGQTRGWRRAGGWGLGLSALVVGSFMVNLAVADRWPVYRVALPLTATVLVGATVALLMLGGRVLARCGLLALLVPGIWLARRQTYALIAWPQAMELAVLQEAAARIDPDRHPRVFVLTPSPDEHFASRVYSDEFGSLSTDSDWVPKEMLKLILRERYPDRPDAAAAFTYQSGRRLPPRQRFDVVIDLHRLRDLRRLAPD